MTTFSTILRVDRILCQIDKNQNKISKFVVESVETYHPNRAASIFQRSLRYVSQNKKIFELRCGQNSSLCTAKYYLNITSLIGPGKSIIQDPQSNIRLCQPQKSLGYIRDILDVCEIIRNIRQEVKKHFNNEFLNGKSK